MAVALAFHPGAALAACQYQNLMPEFLAFEQRTHDLPPARRARIFAGEFAPRHAEFYGEMGHIEGYSGLPPADRLTQDSHKRSQISAVRRRQGAAVLNCAAKSVHSWRRDRACDLLIQINLSFARDGSKCRSSHPQKFGSKGSYYPGCSPSGMERSRANVQVAEMDGAQGPN
ncbi:MAG: hypothetical protein J0I19_09000 [Alphaproteobacteria bacterium]|nr:hypothetical protein [Alphaproteobacteria bacterium]